ncbi:MAG: non-hydrolyzing UDP-N-acetylglucosamine 2-epimerase [Eubacteriales bacterium]
MNPTVPFSFRPAVLVGTRADAIKLAPLILEIGNRKLPLTVLNSGQHGESVEDTLARFGCSTDRRLTGDPSTELPLRTANLLAGIHRLLSEEGPSVLIVHGDTATAYAGAVAAFLDGIPVCHVEAGLRSHRLSAPFPEEFFRRSVAPIAALHFAPTESARENLLAEGLPPDRIFVTGNTVVDALRLTLGDDFRSRPRRQKIRNLLITLHRRESREEIPGMISAVETVLRDYPHCIARLMLHPNPQIAGIQRAALPEGGKIRCFPPMEVWEFHRMLADTDLILTDSGGIQEEAVTLGIPTLVLREVTERSEGVDAGPLMLIGRKPETIRRKLAEILENPESLPPAPAKNPYGDGQSAARIVDILVNQRDRLK